MQGVEVALEGERRSPLWALLIYSTQYSIFNIKEYISYLSDSYLRIKREVKYMLY